MCRLVDEEVPDVEKEEDEENVETLAVFVLCCVRGCVLVLWNAFFFFFFFHVQEKGLEWDREEEEEKEEEERMMENYVFANKKDEEIGAGRLVMGRITPRASQFNS